MGLGTTGNVGVSSARCCVLFDPADGNIHHIHRVVTMRGAKETSEREMEARILHLAKERGLDTNRLQLLHVDPEAIAHGTGYAVDPKTRKLKKRSG